MPGFQGRKDFECHVNRTDYLTDYLTDDLTVVRCHLTVRRLSMCAKKSDHAILFCDIQMTEFSRYFRGTCEEL